MFPYYEEEDEEEDYDSDLNDLTPLRCYNPDLDNNRSISSIKEDEEDKDEVEESFSSNFVSKESVKMTMWNT